jgi:hypothetical protein
MAIPGQYRARRGIPVDQGKHIRVSFLPWPDLATALTRTCRRYSGLT